ncbi:MAG TPA: S8 family serine peptidase [Longimicrobium sp.]
MKRSLATLALATFGLAACADDIPTDVSTPSAPRQPAASAAAYLPGKVIVRFKGEGFSRPSVSMQERIGMARREVDEYGVTVERALLLPGAFVLEVQPGMEEQVVSELNEDPSVEFAELDYLITVVPCETGDCDTPDDNHFGRKWDLHNPGSITLAGVTTATGAADADMDWVEAYEALGDDFGGSAIIGIVDSGIRASHLELAGRVIAARNFASGYPATLIEDRDGHGTHVAGIAAASGAGSMRGVAYGSGIKLVNAKACERYIFPDGIIRTSCPNTSIADAIVWATDQGAKVINLSVGGSPLATVGPAIQQAALQYARGKGTLPFCATGNDNAATIAFPARFPECVAVGSTNWSDTRASYSNRGPGIDMAAPGGASTATSLSLILSASNSADNLYSYKAGTSMATPQAAGLAALLFARGVGSADAVLARMTETVDDLGTAGYDDSFGAGRINVCRALDPAQLSVDMPGSFNRTSEGTFTVVIHAVPGFDPARLDEANLTLGDGTAAGARVEVKGGAYRSSLVDMDADGDLDLVVKFSRPDMATNVASGSTALVLRGNVGCRRVEGREPVNVLR